uniref:Uncharacterized protein n=1 Tax=Brassica oleracea var. oleracea TaxID=109376 RepID=A0A0D2ZUI0_BRAOL
MRETVWVTADLNNTRQKDTFFMDNVATKLAREKPQSTTWLRDSSVKEGKSVVRDFLAFISERW